MTIDLANFNTPYRWVRLDVHCKATGDTPDAVHARRRKRQWTDGINCGIGPDGKLWVNPEEVNRWVEQGPTAGQSGHCNARSTAHAA
jgi:hypothetical protein